VHSVTIKSSIMADNITGARTQEIEELDHEIIGGTEFKEAEVEMKEKKERKKSSTVWKYFDLEKMHVLKDGRANVNLINLWS
jgi:hypothetical protein